MIRAVSCALAASLIGTPQSAHSQGTSAISGQLLDRVSRRPLVGAAVIVLGTPFTSHSDTAGRFTRAGLTPGVYVMQVRALGYAGGSWVVEVAPRETLSVTIELEAAPVNLAGVTVEGKPWEQRGIEGFDERREKKRGIYLTEDEIARVGNTRLSDLLRSVSGVRVVCRYTGCRVRMARTNCQPNFVVNGLPANNSTSLEMPVVGLIAVEIYRTSSETPVEFLHGSNTCGTIVIWTRSGL